MRIHNGMRPHDIVILLKIVSKGSNNFHLKDIAQELYISPGEISESIHRSTLAGFISGNMQIMKSAFMEFLVHGLKYVFPQKPGEIVRGIGTAHSAQPLNSMIVSDEPYVWQYAEGTLRGQCIKPLYPSAPIACLQDERLYELLALTDALRVGKSREQKLATEELEKRIWGKI